MFHLPTFPSWHELHPLIVHFPIALLLVAPLFVIAGAILSPGRGRPFLVSAFVLMLLGTGAMLLAVGTGGTAANLAPHLPAVRAVLEHHQDLAQSTGILFSLLTFAFGSLLFVPRCLQRELDPKLNAKLLAAFMIFYITGALFLVNTAHQGARLVHEFGVTARAAAEQTALKD